MDGVWDTAYMHALPLHIVGHRAVPKDDDDFDFPGDICSNVSAHATL